VGRDALLQRDACQCCVESVSISNVTRIDTPARMGHNFDVNINLTTPANTGAGQCTLQWFEKTNVPYMPTMVAGAWNDMFTLAPTSPTFGPWVNRATGCGLSIPVTIHDIPSLGRTPGRTVSRTLEFNIVVNSSATSSADGCTDPSKSVTAKQVLVMTGGAPDWGASSFA